MLKREERKVSNGTVAVGSYVRVLVPYYEGAGLRKGELYPVTALLPRDETEEELDDTVIEVAASVGCAGRELEVYR